MIKITKIDIENIFESKLNQAKEEQDDFLVWLLTKMRDTVKNTSEKVSISAIKKAMRDWILYIIVLSKKENEENEEEILYEIAAKLEE